MSRRTQVLALGGTVVVSSFALNIFYGSLPVYLSRNLGYSVEAVGLLVGIAFVPQLIAPLVVGPLVDRYGARLAIRTGAACYVASVVLFLASGSAVVVGAARVLQGLGFALIVPAAYTLVPDLVPERWRGSAVGGFGALLNAGFAAGPPAGLWLLQRSPTALFAAAGVAAVAGSLGSWLIAGRPPESTRDGFFTFRRAWAPLLAVTFLTVVYFGVITAFLPLSVPTAQVINVGWYFTADALAVLAFRVPAGYLTDHYGPRWLLLAGIAITVLGVLVLLLPTSLWWLVVAGAATGAGAALLLPPILVELGKRSDAGDRGTAMALYSTSFAAAIGIGSLAAAPVVDRVGFEPALLLSTAVCVLAVPVVLVSIKGGVSRLSP